jgi:hypothetical protein
LGTLHDQPVAVVLDLVQPVGTGRTRVPAWGCTAEISMETCWENNLDRTECQAVSKRPRLAFVGGEPGPPGMLRDGGGLHRASATG